MSPENSLPILFIASTNLPWTLDLAIIRRFQRIFSIDLPNSQDRMAIIHKNLSRGIKLPSSLNLECIAEATRGYSGSDLVRGCSEAKSRLFRRMVEERRNNKRPSGVSSALATEELLETLKVTKATTGIGEARWKKQYEQWKGKRHVEK